MCMTCVQKKGTITLLKIKDMGVKHCVLVSEGHVRRTLKL